MFTSDSSAPSPCSKKSGFIHHLRHGSNLGIVPHHGRQHVLARLELRRNVERLITPMFQIAARRPRSHAPAIHKKLVTVIAAHMNNKLARRRRQRERFPEMENAIFAVGPSGCRIQFAFQRSVGNSALMVWECEMLSGSAWNSTMKAHANTNGRESIGMDFTS